MAYEGIPGIQIGTLQVRQACPEALRNNYNIDWQKNTEIGNGAGFKTHATTGSPSNNFHFNQSANSFTNLAIYRQEPPIWQSNSEQRHSGQSKTELHKNFVYGHSKWAYSCNT